MFENIKTKKNPIGLEFIKKGLLTEMQVARILEYQKEHKELKFGEIADILDMCDKSELLEVISDKLQIQGVMLSSDLNINPVDYLPRDIIINYRALPFKVDGNRVSIAFANYQDISKVKEIELMLMNAGYEMEPYVTLYTSIMKQIGDVRSVENKFVDKDEKDTTKLIDNIIMTGIQKRASDIHFEPMEDKIRVRFRIDGELVNITELPKDRQQIVTGRLKAISNMHQELTYDQDGSIDSYDNFSIRVSSQKNVHGEKFVLRLLKKNSDVRNIFELGFPENKELVSKSFEKRNSLILVCAPTGER
ncbi:MAG: ATPase, T2SS/T4P/T4SS family [Clostridia bacterium]